MLACAASDGLDWSTRGVQLYRAGRFAEAETAYRRALDMYDRTGQGASLTRALTLENIAVMLRAQGRYADSVTLHLEALPRIEELAGAQSVEAARAGSNLAALYWSMGRLDLAEPLATRAEASFEAMQGTIPDREANRQVLASIYLTQHRYEEGEKLLQTALRGGDGVNAVSAYSNLAAAALGVNENARAEMYARHAVETAQHELPSNHPLTAVALNNLAQACRFEGKYLEAENGYREAIAIWEQRLGGQHPDLARGLMNLAAFYHERGREAGAEDLYVRAAGIFEMILGKNSAEALVVRSELADVLRAEKRYTEAEKISRATLPVMRGKLTVDDPRLVRAEMNYAHLREESKGVGRRDVKVAALR